jgi:hypothetical protein
MGKTNHFCFYFTQLQKNFIFFIEPAESLIMMGDADQFLTHPIK